MSIARVHYRERQRLTTADLRAEQEYRLALGGRHHLAHHDWGVVRGLRLVQDGSQFLLTPGVAIDACGREIVVPKRMELLDVKARADECDYVLLYFCEYPQQVPPGRACEEEPAPRSAQIARVSIAKDFRPRESCDGLAGARAAGAGSTTGPWAVPVARIGELCAAEDIPDLVTYAAVRYVRHRASVVRSPTGRARIQLGIDSRTDVYHFLLSTADLSGTLARRIAIDRDGTLHIWKRLVVSGAVTSGGTVLPEGQQFLISGMPMSAGAFRRIRVFGTFNAFRGELTASFAELGVPKMLLPAVFTAVHTVTPGATISGVLTANALGAQASFSVLDPVDRRLLRRPRAARSSVRRVARAEPEEATQEFSLLLGPTLGRLRLCAQPETTESRVVECGDVDRTRPGRSEPGTPVLRLRPAAAAADDPLAREIYAVTTSGPLDPVPRTELRISGGLEDKSDASTRVSFGTRKAGSPGVWIPRFRMDGGRRIDILAGSKGTALRVERTLYLPPIGKDDPLLPEMLSMAFMAGLRQIGKLGVTTKASITLPVDPLASGSSGSDPKYDLKVDFVAGTVLMRVVEVLRGVVRPGDLTFRTLTGLSLPATGSTTTFKPALPPALAAGAQLEVLLLVKEGAVQRLVIAEVRPSTS
jgi:hypothetical protein